MPKHGAITNLLERATSLIPKSISQVPSLTPYMINRYLSLAALFSLAFIACRNQPNIMSKGKPLARVFDNYLYLSDIDPSQFVAGMGKEDSAQVINLYIENWLRKQVVLHEAENANRDNTEINRLVKDYYNSLLVQQYENALVRERIDSTLTQVDLQTYYDANKKQYTLDNTILRCYFIKVKNTTPDLAKLKGLWKPNEPLNYNEVLVYCNQHKDSLQYSLDDEVWHEIDFVADKLPAAALNAAAAGTRDYINSDNDHTYFFRVLDYYPVNSIPPLSYLQKDITDIILYQRKAELLNNLSKDLYNAAKNENEIEVY